MESAFLLRSVRVKRFDLNYEHKFNDTSNNSFLFLPQREEGEENAKYAKTTRKNAKKKLFKLEYFVFFFKKIFYRKVSSKILHRSLEVRFSRTFV
jgi:hypothetical protein